MSKGRVLLFLLPLAACADVLGIKDFTFVDGGITSDAMTVDGSTDASMQEGGMDVAMFDITVSDVIDLDVDSGACTLCMGGSTAPCAMACNETNPRFLTTDQTRLYWANVNGNTATIRSMLRSTPGSAANITTSNPAPNALAAVADQVLWTDGSNLRGAFLDGGVRVLATTAKAQSVAVGPAQSPNFAFWASGIADGGILRCSMPDCLGTIVQIDRQTDVRGLVTVWDSNASAPYGFWVEYGGAGRPVNGAIVLGGFNVMAYATPNTTTDVLAAEDKSKLFYTTYANGTTDVYQYSVVQPRYTAINAFVTGIVAGGGNAWIAVDDPNNGRIVKLIGGGGSMVLVQNDFHPSSIALDGTYVYWTRPDGRVMRAGR